MSRKDDIKQARLIISNALRIVRDVQALYSLPASEAVFTLATMYRERQNCSAEQHLNYAARMIARDEGSKRLPPWQEN